MSNAERVGVPLYKASEVRALDREAIEREGIPGAVLMARAGRAAFDLLRRVYPERRVLEVVCGAGNNGGDGFVVARLARDHGFSVRLQLVGDAQRLQGDALAAADAARAAGVVIDGFDAGVSPAGDAVVVDALLGTGFGGEPRPAQAQAIDWMNASGLPVLAIDLPSGLCADTGAARGAAVRAAHTISFIGRKRGVWTGEGAEYCGERHFDGLGVPARVFDRVAPSARLLELAPLRAMLPTRQRNAHKGHFGHVLVVGGNHGMAGAALMAAQAAARCGAGLVSVAVRPGNEAALVARCPELMARGVAHCHELEPLLARASVIVLGPGLGRGAWAGQMLRTALSAGLPTVIDADALNGLADGEAQDLLHHSSKWVLTPHPGEAARLLGLDTAVVSADRFAAVQALQKRYPGTIVLKGSGTLVAGEGSHAVPGVCPYGNPGMASGGMGDVLSGILGALLAQGLDGPVAAPLGVCLHAQAADLATAREGERGLLASDLIPLARALLNGHPGA
jgi:NAD(P)H-hydrate epimerase